MLLTRGYVGKEGELSKASAAVPITVPRAHGIPKYEIPPMTYPGRTADDDAAKAFTKYPVSIYNDISIDRMARTRRSYNNCTKIGHEQDNGEDDPLLGCHGEKRALEIAIDLVVILGSVDQVEQVADGPDLIRGNSFGC